MVAATVSTSMRAKLRGQGRSTTMARILTKPTTPPGSVQKVVELRRTCLMTYTQRSIGCRPTFRGVHMSPTPHSQNQGSSRLRKPQSVLLRTIGSSRPLKSIPRLAWLPKWPGLSHLHLLQDPIKAKFVHQPDALRGCKFKINYNNNNHLGSFSTIGPT